MGYLVQFLKPGGFIRVVDIAFTRELWSIEDAPEFLRPQNPKHWSYVHRRARGAVFAAGIEFADTEVGDEECGAEFAAAFDRANGWNLTVGLYWDRPWAFLSLDHSSRVYVTRKLGVSIGRHGPPRMTATATSRAVVPTF